MTPEEFKKRIEETINTYLGRYPNAAGCDFFIHDMQELFEEWEAESQHLER